jgi:hypothetical protein
LDLSYPKYLEILGGFLIFFVSLCIWFFIDFCFHKICVITALQRFIIFVVTLSVLSIILTVFWGMFCNNTFGRLTEFDANLESLEMEDGQSPKSTADVQPGSPDNWSV